MENVYRFAKLPNFTIKHQRVVNANKDWEFFPQGSVEYVQMGQSLTH